MFTDKISKIPYVSLLCSNGTLSNELYPEGPKQCWVDGLAMSCFQWLLFLG